MPECAVCSSFAPHKCSRCKCVFYCSPAHQKEDWPAHKVQCPRLAQEALASVFHPCDEELLLRITTCLAQNGYHKEVGIMVQLNKAFWNDEQIWDAYKDVPGPGGKTRLMFATAKGWLDRVKWLLARGSNVNYVYPRDGTTVLMAASMFGKLEVVRELVKRGAKVNAARTSNGCTALMLATEHGHLGVVCELCEVKANLNAFRKPPLYGNALLIACEVGNLAIARELIRRGIDVHAAKTNVGYTALMWASKKGHLGMVCELLGAGANVNAATTDRGSTALTIACENGHLEVVRELCKRGVNVNAALIAHGVTPLAFAVKGGFLEIVRELCVRGADVNLATTDTGATPLMTAAMFGNVEIARLLLKWGANKAAKDIQGIGTTFDLANGPHEAALQALLRH